MWIYILIGVVALLLVFFVVVYNKLVNARNKVDNQFSQIDIQLKRRIDLIPNLVETVKGYAKHEKETLTGVIEARNAASNAKNVNEKIKANNDLSGQLSKIFALAESYPDLKSNENFLSLQNDLKETEDKISYARSFYNDSAMQFNNIVQMFPTNIVAGMTGFKKYEFFTASEEEKKTPEVKF